MGSEVFLKKYSKKDKKTAFEFLKNWVPFLSEDLCTKCVGALNRRVETLNSGRVLISCSDHSTQVFLSKYTRKDKETASEFLRNWVPFLSEDLCPKCVGVLNRRIESLNSDVDGGLNFPSNKEHSFSVKTPDSNGNDIKENHKYCKAHSLDNGKEGVVKNDTAGTNSLGTWKGAECKAHSLDNGKEGVVKNDTTGTNSLGTWKGAEDINTGTNSDSWKDGTDNLPEPIFGSSTNGAIQSTEAPGKLSWGDISQEDQQLDDYEESEDSVVSNSRKKAVLSRDQWEFIRFNSVQRKKDFICLERFKGKLVNIVEGLELHTGVFSAIEQKRIVDFVYKLQEMGMKGELKARTFTAPTKWMKGKGRVTIQFGCCYNYAYDKQRNPPGILQRESVDPIPHLLKVMIRRLVTWHVLPPSCVPDSCIVNIYDEGDCIPPHIDNHDFVRPFSTVSFLSECDILFGSNLSIVGPGEFSGPMAIPLPVGSVLVLNGNGADMAKHCVPAVPTKRISITFRKMDESKQPFDFVPEPDLQGLQPLSYETKTSNVATPARSNLPESGSSQMLEKPYMRNGPDRGVLPIPPPIRQQTRIENYRDRSRGSLGRGKSYSDPHSSPQVQVGHNDRREDYREDTRREDYRDISRGSSGRGKSRREDYREDTRREDYRDISRGSSGRGKSRREDYREDTRREDYRDISRGSSGRGKSYSDPHSSLQDQVGPNNKRKVRATLNDRGYFDY